MQIDLGTIASSIAWVVGPSGLIAAFIMWRKSGSEIGKTEAEIRQLDWKQWEAENNYLRQQLREFRERLEAVEVEVRECREREVEYLRTISNLSLQLGSAPNGEARQKAALLDATRHIVKKTGRDE